MAFMTALAIPILHMLTSVIWEHCCLGMILLSCASSASAKAMISAKKMRMSASVNKNFSEADISSLMFRDADKVGHFVWYLGDFIESPFKLMFSIYFTFKYVGKYGLLVLFLTSIQLILGY